jgi:hypothetical protein
LCVAWRLRSRTGCAGLSSRDRTSELGDCTSTSSGAPAPEYESPPQNACGAAAAAGAGRWLSSKVLCISAMKFCWKDLSMQESAQSVSTLCEDVVMFKKFR